LKGDVLLLLMRDYFGDDIEREEWNGHVEKAGYSRLKIVRLSDAKEVSR
jgi:hypothetical protein